jgi:cytochrome b6-f complex iron-sulfur subunit
MATPTSLHQPMQKDAGRFLNRRGFLGLAFVGALAAVAGQWLGALYQFLRPPKSQGFGGMIYAGRIEEFPQGSVNRIMAGRFYITHGEDGLLALYQKCTHLGCSVPWAEAEGQFHCPCHGSLFTKKGEVVGGPAPRPLDLFQIFIKNGEVWVDTSQPKQRNRYEPSQAMKV